MKFLLFLLPFVLMASTGVLSNSVEMSQNIDFEFKTVKKLPVIARSSKILEDSIITLDAKGVLYALDTNNSSRLKWQLDLSEKYSSASLSYTNGYIFCVIENIVYAIDAEEGKMIWQEELRAPIRGEAVVLSDKLIALTIDNYLYAMNMKDGSIDWTNQGSAVELTKLNSVSPVAAGNIVLVPFSSGDVVAFDEYGTKLWNNKLQVNSLDSPFTDITTTPRIGKEKVIATNESSIFALDLSSGKELWSKALSVKSISEATEDHIFLVTKDNKVASLDLSNGELIWTLNLTEKIKINKSTYFGEPIFAKNKLFIATNQGLLIQINPISGVIERRINIPKGVYHPLVFANSSLYITTDKSDFYIISE